jgi:Fe-S-cluster containining protein
MLRRGLDGLSTETRREIEGRARSQIAAIAQAFPRLARSPFLDDWSDNEQDALATAFAEFPCPALDVDGGCRVYDARPVTCRTMGIPLEAGETVEGACEIQTAVPVVRLPPVFREQEEGLAGQEARELQNAKGCGEEILIAYGFLPERAWTGF